MTIILQDLPEARVQVAIRLMLIEVAVCDAIEQRKVGCCILFGGSFPEPFRQYSVRVGQQGRLQSRPLIRTAALQGMAERRMRSSRRRLQMARR